MRIKNSYFWAIAIGSLIVDILTKREIYRVFNLEPDSEIIKLFGIAIGREIERNPPYPPTIPLIPDIFHFTYLRNCGAAFSILQGHGAGILGFLSLLVSAGLVYFGLTKNWTNLWLQLGCGAILAGAAGNGIDRLLFGGCVVDFIDVRAIRFAVFNWADISINIGVACLLIYNFKDWQQQSARR